VLEALRNRLLDEGHDEVVAMHALKGSVSTSSDEVFDVVLVRTLDHLFLASGKTEGWALFLDDNYTYKSKMLEDHLVVRGDEGDVVLKVPTGDGADVKQTLGMARLRLRHGQRRSLLDVHLNAEDRLIETMTPLHAEVAVCVAGEAPLLVWLVAHAKPRTPDGKKAKSHFQNAAPVSSSEDVETRFWMTPSAQGLVHFNAVGDVAVERLQGELKVKSEVGKDRVRVGERSFLTSSDNETVFHDVMPWFAFDEADRLAASVAHALSHQQERQLGALLAQRLHLAEERGSALAAWLKVGLGERAGDDVLLQHLRRLHRQAGALSDALAPLRLQTGEEVVVLERGMSLARDADADDANSDDDDLNGRALREVLLDLHKKTHAALTAEGNPLTLASADAALAEHLLQVQLYDEVETLLDARLATLPNEDITDLLLTSTSDGADGPLGFRIRLLELLEQARGQGNAHLPTRRRLAELAPLDAHRLQFVLEAIDEDASSPPNALASRTREVLGLLTAEALRRRDDDVDMETPALLADDLVEGHLRHPASRKGHALGFLQGLLAEQTVPDKSALKAYCERLTETSDAHRQAREALARASVVLGVPAVDGYISRGDKSVGLFAYEGRPSFVLLGGRHLDDNDDLQLTASELRFAIGTEVAHLRFQHTRVTSQDVWNGAWNKGKASVNFVLGMLPLFKGLKPIDRISDLIELARNSAVGKVLTGVGVTDDALKQAGLKAQKELELEGQIGAMAGELLATHRVMLLTADRAGLLLNRDLHAALRALFLESASTAAELSVAQLMGLPACLARAEFDDTLALRVSSLLSFYLSADWDALQQAPPPLSGDDGNAKN